MPDLARKRLASFREKTASNELKELRAKLRGSLYEFVRWAWPIVEPAVAFVDAWHIRAICEHLEAVSDGRIRSLIINIPPGHAKSLLVSVFWPVWHWLERPAFQAWFSSYADDVNQRDAIRRLKLLTDDRFTAMFPTAVELTQKHNAKHFYRNTAGGFHYCSTVGGAGTGMRADAIIIDDPLNALDVPSQVARRRVLYWYDNVMGTRHKDARTGCTVLMMQRLHEEDLTGHLLREFPGEFEHLCLPAEFDPGRAARTCIGFKDPRKEEGVLLFPEIFSGDVLAKHKRRLRGDYAGQFQQRPAPAEGSLFRREWFNRRWRLPGETRNIEGVPARVIIPATAAFDEMCMTVDCAFKRTDESDRVAIQVWGRIGPDKLLLDTAWARMTFTETVRAILDLRAKWPACRAILIEEAANGAAVIDVLKAKLSGVIAIKPEGSKDARAAAVTPEFEAGNVLFPASAPWVVDLIEEFIAFPKASHDDGVDAATYALRRLTPSSDAAKFDALATW
jgi:predicted phage terminase large subunit-like protein